MHIFPTEFHGKIAFFETFLPKNMYHSLLGFWFGITIPTAIITNETKTAKLWLVSLEWASVLFSRNSQFNSPTSNPWTWNQK